MKPVHRLGSAVIVALLTAAVANFAPTRAADNPAKRVKIIGGGVELIDVKPTSDQCGKQTGEAIRLRVTSESPIDVRMYMKVVGGRWMNKDFANQKKGDEISSYRCDTKPDYKIYSHAVGSADAWPKP